MISFVASIILLITKALNDENAYIEDFDVLSFQGVTYPACHVN